MSIHVIHFFGPINPVSAERFRDICLEAVRQGATEIRVHFSSDGGTTSFGFALYNFIRSLPVPVVMHNMGNIESMAVVVFLAGTRRLACPHTRFLTHALHFGFPASVVDHGRLREHVGGLNDDVERYAQIFDERCSGADQPMDVRLHLLGNEKILSATAAKAAGVVHEVAAAAIPAGAALWWVAANQ